MITLLKPGGVKKPYCPAIQADVLQINNILTGVQNNTIPLGDINQHLPNTPHVRMTTFVLTNSLHIVFGVPFLILPFNPQRLFFVIAAVPTIAFPVATPVGYFTFGYPANGTGAPFSFDIGIPLFYTVNFQFSNYASIDNDIWFWYTSSFGRGTSPIVAIEGTATDFSNVTKH